MEAVKEGTPGIAAFTASNQEVSFTTLTPQPNAASTKAALLYADLTTLVTGTIFDTGVRPFLPPNVVLMLNYPAIDGCSAVSIFTFVLARLINTIAQTVQICNQTQLPLVTQAGTAKCAISVMALNATTFDDAGVDAQTFVMSQLSALPLSCL